MGIIAELNHPCTQTIIENASAVNSAGGFSLKILSLLMMRFLSNTRANNNSEQIHDSFKNTII